MTREDAQALIQDVLRENDICNIKTSLERSGFFSNPAVARMMDEASSALGSQHRVG